MTIKRMDLAWITVSDIARAKKFFVDTLGLKLNNDAPGHGWMELQGADGGGVLLGVGANHEEKPLVGPGQNAVLTMSVDDLDVSMAALKAKGVTFVGEVIEIPGHVRIVFFVDPDNNKFQLVQDVSK
jgi:predicted enzyme related to lactoylglutathione lyase